MTLQFVPLSTFIEPGFWSELTRLKLDQYQLDETPKKFAAYYCNSDIAGAPSRLSIDFNALSSECTVPANSLQVEGDLFLCNTIEGFKSLNRRLLLEQFGSQIWETIKSGKALTEPACLSACVITCYADIKKYKYHYWAAIPSVCFPLELSQSEEPISLSDQAIRSILSEQQLAQLPQLIRSTKSGTFLLSLPSTSTAPVILPFCSLLSPDLDISTTLLCVSDPSTQPNVPGWPLRNALAAFAFHKPSVSSIRVLCWRQRYQGGKVDIGQSFILSLRFQPAAQTPSDWAPKFVGWEKGAEGQLGSRLVDMSTSMDPVKLAEGAIDLNLQLMRWRQVPSLDLQSMQSTRCLLLGAGTLGCNVSRSLLGWGVRNITLLDYGNVSYSNPVRQSLFRFQDSLNGGQPKALAAQKALLEIFPSANIRGITMAIPMPGHLVDSKEEEKVKESVETLTRLIEEHDAVFLLMDSREGRWLPTLLSTAKSKVCFSVALGFDSYVVIRHGFGPSEKDALPLKTPLIPGNQLGCYYCTDVSVPGNSLRDRTLDQQCTVTRPGVSMMAGGLAVELLASLIQHPDKALAPAPTGSTEESDGESGSCLGLVPHQIRGFLSRFQQITPTVQRFQHCIGCSPRIVNEYNSRGWEFLRDAFNSPDTLEVLAGLKELKDAAEAMEILELSDSESVMSACD